MTVAIFGAAASGTGVPAFSIDFERSIGQRLTISDTNFGAYDRAKFAISLWVKRESIGSGDMGLYCHGSDGSDIAFFIRFNGSNQLRFNVSSGGVSTSGELLTNATYESTSSFYHIMAHYDSANVTADNRMRLWVDGAEVTSFATRTNPSSAVFNSTAAISVGSLYAGDGVPTFDGLIYQATFFSGSLPAIGEVYFGGKPKDVRGIAGIKSSLAVAGGVVTEDDILVEPWFNTLSAVSSTVIP